MKTVEIKKYNNALDLPADWDEVAKDNIYLKRDFLRFIESTEKGFLPKYYLFFKALPFGKALK